MSIPCSILSAQSWFHLNKAIKRVKLHVIVSSAYLFLQLLLVITEIENIAKFLIIFDQFN